MTAVIRRRAVKYAWELYGANGRAVAWALVGHMSDVHGEKSFLVKDFVDTDGGEWVDYQDNHNSMEIGVGVLVSSAVSGMLEHGVYDIRMAPADLSTVRFYEFQRRYIAIVVAGDRAYVACLNADECGTWHGWCATRLLPGDAVSKHRVYNMLRHCRVRDAEEVVKTAELAARERP